MTAINLSLGSNVEAEHHIRAGLTELQQAFGLLRISRVFESEAVGFDGDNFLNLVVRTETAKSLAELSIWLKDLEHRHGRRRGGERFSDRTLDVDVLTYGDLYGEHEGIVLPRPEIRRNAFVLWPLSEVNGEGVDPESGKTYARLWQEYDRQSQKLWPIDFTWQGRLISRAETP